MSNKWKGPGIVICQDRKVAFIRHGSVYVRVSPNRLTKMGEEFRNIESNNDDHYRPCSDSEKENVIRHQKMTMVKQNLQQIVVAWLQMIHIMI